MHLKRFTIWSLKNEKSFYTQLVYYLLLCITKLFVVVSLYCCVFESMAFCIGLFALPSRPPSSFVLGCMLCNLVTTTTLVKMAKYHVLDSKEALSENFSKFVEDLSRSSIANHGYFAIGLSGGSSATIVSNSLSSKDLEWGKWHVYFCDERFVKLSDPDSNYNSLKAIFFDKVPIPKDQIYTVDAENGIENAALDYSKKITSLFGDSQLPKFDLLVLGMGPDGHICSLFPNHPLLDEKEKWVAFLVDSPKPPPQRITLTLPILNNAKAVCFTVTGGSKAEMIQNVKQKPLDRNIPASMVQSQEGEIHWFMDKDAAKLLA